VARAEARVIWPATPHRGRQAYPRQAEDEADLRRMLILLSAASSLPVGVCAIDAAGTKRTKVSDTIFIFKPLSAPKSTDYVASGEGMGNAAAMHPGPRGKGLSAGCRAAIGRGRPAALRDARTAAGQRDYAC